MRRLAVLLVLNFGWVASASDCTRPLTDGEVVARMNAALTPALGELGRRLRGLATEEIRALALARANDPAERELVDQLSDSERALGIYESFEGWFRFSPRLTLQGPYTKTNRTLMRRLTRAVTVASHLIDHWGEVIRTHPAFLAELELMRRHSATGEDVVFNLKLACETVLQGLSALTASPLPGLTPEEILTRITGTEGCRPSLINQYALALTSGQLGSNGDLIYIVDPLSFDGGCLRFSPRFRTLMKAARAAFDRETANVGEFGKGCPVAHTLDGFDRTGVQEFVDGVMHVYHSL